MTSTFLAGPTFRRLLDMPVGIDQPLRSPSDGGTRVRRDERETRISLDLPGVAPSDLSVTVDDVPGRGQHLVVSWTRKDLDTEETGERRWALAGRFDLEGLAAHAEHGVLTIVLPHAAKPEPRRIDVAVGRAPKPMAVESTTSEPSDGDQADST